MRTAAIAMALVVACTPREASPPAPLDIEEPAPRDRTLDPVSVQFHVVGEAALEPPLVELQVDVVVLNHASEARWVLLPRQAGARPLERGGVDVLEVERWGDVTVGSWLGTGGFRAVRLGPDAHVQLRGMAIQWRRHDDEPARWLSLGVGASSLEALACRELVVDGRRATTWFDSDPTAHHDRGGDAPAVLATVRHRDDHAEVAAELVEPIEVRYVPWPRD